LFSLLLLVGTEPFVFDAGGPTKTFVKFGVAATRQSCGYPLEDLEIYIGPKIGKDSDIWFI